MGYSRALGITEFQIGLSFDLKVKKLKHITGRTLSTYFARLSLLFFGGFSISG
jgi:hypothetical protein